MNRIIAISACAIALPGAALAASRTYDTAAFEGVSVESGLTAEISVGATRSVTAETSSDNFDDLRISVKDNVLLIERPASSWFSFGHSPSYKVHVVTPVLHSLTASSGTDVHVSGVNGGNLKVHASSGSKIDIAGNCASLEADASSGSILDAGDLKCENVSLQASSGSNVSVAAAKSVTGHASSGSDVRVRGKPSTVQVNSSSGAHLAVAE